MSEATSEFHAAPGAPLDADEVPEVTAEGGDWADVLNEIKKISSERVVVNLGPVHPSTHGVLRLVVELDGEVVRQVRVGTGYLHTGIEKNMEYRTWTQGVTFCTRMDYVAPFFQEVGYCLAVERLLGITDRVPKRATEIRVLLMELNRIASHLVAIGSTGNELGGTTFMTVAFKGREEILRIFEAITGLRMNHAYVRPGGVAEDVPDNLVAMVREKLPNVRRFVEELEDLSLDNPIFIKRFRGIAYLPLSAIVALGTTGPIARAAGLPLDLRKTQPYCGYENYDFDVPTYTHSDAYDRMKVRFDECYQSMRIVNQVLGELDADQGAPTMVDDPEIAWPARLSIGSDGQGTSPAHIKEIMGLSMESLIHHFKLVTEGFRVPAGEVYQMIEHAKGILGVHVVSDGGTRPYRAHFRDPSFANLQALSMMAEGGQLADLIVAVASIDPVLGGVDR